MYKVMIVDDDAIVRLDLRTIINWRELNFDLMPDASDGEEALENVKTYEPDILILDLFMPQMDGFQVLKELNERGYKGKIIVLSCHDEFESVKDALKAGAFDYLRKQFLERDELVRVLDKAVESIEADRFIYKQKSIDLGDCLIESVLKNDMVSALIYGRISDIENLRNKLAELKLEIPLQNIVLIAIEIDDLSRNQEVYPLWDREALIKSAINLVDKTLTKTVKNLCGTDGSGKIYCICGFESKLGYLSISSILYSAASQIRYMLTDELKITASIGISEICHDIKQLPLSLKQANYALSCKFFKGRGSIIHYSDAKRYKNGLPEDMNRYEKKVEEVLAGNGNIRQFISEMYNEFKDKEVSINTIRKFNINFVYYLKKIMDKLEVGEEEVFGCVEVPVEYVVRLEFLDDVVSWLAKACMQIANIRLSRTVRCENREEIKRAIEYVERHYMDDINLETISEYINLSPAYFSRLFKKLTGQNFIEYLNRFRISKALELLKTTDMKVYEVANYVGIDNYRYFSKLFKEVTGITPQHIKKLNAKDKDKI